MIRREIIVLLGSLAILRAVPAGAQQPKRLPMVALLAATGPVADLDGAEAKNLAWRGFLHGLRDLGWMEGQNVIIERRSAQGDVRLAPALVSELLASGADVIALGGARWLHDAALRSNPGVPMVTIFQDDPVASGLVASLARPGGNLTGIAQTTGPEFYRKRLQLLREVAPQSQTIALMGPRTVLEQDRTVVAAAGVSVLPVQLESDGQLDEAFSSVLRQRSDALIVAGSAVTYGNSSRIVAFASQNKLPTLFPFREAIEAGGLMSYGSGVPGNFREMARLVDKLLRGGKVAELPVEQPTKFELVINLRTAKALGLTLPDIVLAQADEVIE